jgi:hypothetical protein
MDLPFMRIELHIEVTLDSVEYAARGSRNSARKSPASRDAPAANTATTL